MRCGPPKPALRIVISLKNMPKGGGPVRITADRTRSALAIGARVNVPVPIRAKSEELCCWASVPAENSETGFAREW